MRYLSLLLLSLLVSCTDASMAVLATSREAFGIKRGAIDTAKLDSRYQYLRVVHPGGISGMILGFVEPASTGPVEVWYASDGEVLRFQNGRLAGSTGLQPEWRSVVLPLFPGWDALSARNEPFRWERVRDVMPGYRYGVHDKLILTIVPPPRSSRLIGIDAKQLTWFEERVENSTEEPLPPARYAVQGDRVVYAEQCVDRERCFSWQRWPAGT